MTLLYKLFRIPGTIEETIDKSSIYGFIPNITIKRKREDSLVPGAAGYKYKIGIEVGKTKLTILEWTKWFENYVPGIDISLRLDSSYKHAYNVACKVADELTIKGDTKMVVKINGEFYNLRK